MTETSWGITWLLVHAYIYIILPPGGAKSMHIRRSTTMSIEVKRKCGKTSCKVNMK